MRASPPFLGTPSALLVDDLWAKSVGLAFWSARARVVHAARPAPVDVIEPIAGLALGIAGVSGEALRREVHPRVEEQALVALLLLALRRPLRAHEAGADGAWLTVFQRHPEVEKARAGRYRMRLQGVRGPGPSGRPPMGGGRSDEQVARMAAALEAWMERPDAEPATLEALRARRPAPPRRAPPPSPHRRAPACT